VTTGIVKFWKRDKGWGAISSPDLPAGLDAWAHFSAIEGDGFRELSEGDQVDFDFVEAQQESFRYQVTRVRKV
jgi:CspA family cold shock protein